MSTATMTAPHLTYAPGCTCDTDHAADARQWLTNALNALQGPAGTPRQYLATTNDADPIPVRSGQSVSALTGWLIDGAPVTGWANAFRVVIRLGCAQSGTTWSITLDR